MATIRVRFASVGDEDVCRSFDKYLPPASLSYKLREQEILLAEEADEPIGYLRLDYLWGRMPFVDLILVRQGNRKRGVGRALLSALERYLSEAGHSCLYSSSQVDESAPQSWHRRVGFAECGIIAGMNEGGVGEVFFRKNL